MHNRQLITQTDYQRLLNIRMLELVGLAWNVQRASRHAPLKIAA